MFFFGNNLPSCNVNEVKSTMENSKDCLILDVRSVEEYSQAHIAGSKLIPLQVLGNKLGDLKQYKEKEVFVICRSGNRSMSATSMLMKEGFNNVKNVEGGIMSWHRQGHPLKGQ